MASRSCPGAFERHGISTQFAKEHGGPLKPVLDTFHKAVRSAKVLVAHNVNFDAKVVGAEFIKGRPGESG